MEPAPAHPLWDLSYEDHLSAPQVQLGPKLPSSRPWLGMSPPNPLKSEARPEEKGPHPLPRDQGAGTGCGCPMGQPGSAAPLRDARDSLGCSLSGGDQGCHGFSRTRPSTWIPALGETGSVLGLAPAGSLKPEHRYSPLSAHLGRAGTCPEHMKHSPS